MDTDLIGFALIANLESTGPIYVVDTGLDLFDASAQVLLASRVVILCGMGNQRTPLLELQGPVPVSETSNGKYEFYLFQIRSDEQNLQNLHFVIILIFHSSMKNYLKKLELSIERRLRSLANSLDFAGVSTTEISESFKMEIQERLKTVLEELRNELEAMPKGEYSIFDLGFLATLEDDVARVAKQLLLHPAGISLAKLQADQHAIEELMRLGVVKIENSGEERIIVPV